VKPQFASLLTLGLLAWGAASADTPCDFPAPPGLKPCAPGDRFALAEIRIAKTLGGEFLGCFQSGQEVMTPTAAQAVSTRGEYAFAISLRRVGFTTADLENLLATVKAQWKDFDPLSKEFKETYTARLNALIKGNGSTPSPTMISVKPVLVSIDQNDTRYYVVTSIRTYVLNLDGRQATVTKVNSDALALRGSQLIRLTIQRELRDPADVAQVQSEIEEWARATAQSSPSGVAKKAPE
jgi:hypothetical protein